MKALLTYVILPFFLAGLLAGCDLHVDRQERDHSKTFAWAVEICGGKEKIDGYYIYSVISDKVRCADGRYFDIPEPK